MDERERKQPGAWSRRRTLTAGAGAAMLAGLAITRGNNRAAAQVVRTGGGIGGGGQVKEKGARTHFSVFATRFEGDGLAEPFFVGRFRWVDGKADIAIDSTSITFYGPIDGGPANDREIRGLATMNEQENLPFVVRLADFNGPGLGQDEITVFVGEVDAEDPTADPVYTLTGKIDSGDLTLIDFELPF